MITKNTTDCDEKNHFLIQKSVLCILKGCDVCKAGSYINLMINEEHLFQNFVLAFTIILEEIDLVFIKFCPRK